MYEQQKAAPGGYPGAAQSKTVQQNYPQKHHSAQPIQELLSRLDGVKQVGPGRWMAKAPTRRERTASLSIRKCDDGRVLLHDFGGDAVEDVLAAVGLSIHSLFPSRKPPLEGFRPRQGISEYRARELINLAVKEALICALVVSDVLDGRGIAAPDAERARLAVSRIEDMQREVSHAR